MAQRAVQSDDYIMVDDAGNILQYIPKEVGGIGCDGGSKLETQQPKNDNAYIVMVFNHEYMEGIMQAIHKTRQGAEETVANLPEGTDTDIIDVVLYE